MTAHAVVEVLSRYKRRPSRCRLTGWLSRARARRAGKRTPTLLVNEFELDGDWLRPQTTAARRCFWRQSPLSGHRTL